MVSEWWAAGPEKAGMADGRIAETMAAAVAAAGADAIFGHHAHRLQPLELVDGVPVAWGLGNFVWPRLSDLGARSAIARLTVEPDGTTEACLVPVIIEGHGHPVIQDTPQAGDMWCPPAMSSG